MFCGSDEAGGGELGICLRRGQLEQFFRYYETSGGAEQGDESDGDHEMEQVVTKHFLDSLSLVGSGNGALAGR